MPTTWMVRSDGGRRYDDFRDRGVVGIGFHEIALMAKPGVDNKLLVEAFVKTQPGNERAVRDFRCVASPSVRQRHQGG